MKFETASVVATVALMSNSANAQPKGPDPVQSSLEGTGPFSISTSSISDGDTPGFAGCTLYEPTATDVGTYGGVAVVPGFTNTREATELWSTLVASHGFIVMNCDTESRFNFPEARGEQLLEAIDWLANDSPVSGRIDSNRMAVAGYSMGGGGALDAIEADSSIAAAIGLSPYNSDKDFSTATTPTLLIGGESDGTAGVDSHAIPFYNTLAGEKAYLEINNGGHSASRDGTAAAQVVSVAWLKAYLDGDARYTQFICPGPSTGGEIEDYRSSCTGPQLAGASGLGPVSTSNTAMIGAVIGGVVFVAALVGAAFTMRKRSAKAEESKAVTSPDMMI